MRKELDKLYEPSRVEDNIYKFWEDGRYFHAQVDRTKQPYSMVIPPPNITGQLHMGHALNNTLQDILIRYKRMQGYCTVWIPGTDHASIATEAKIVEAMREEGLDKGDVGRDGFMERAWEWNDKYGGTITNQLKKLGSSCDWERQRFTLDEGCSKAVEEVFIHLYEKGLIYRAERIINWCPHCKTSISDIEVEYSEMAGHFWHIKYPLVGSDDYLEIATTRPETLLGDTAVAVHPDDERYKDYIGKKVILPLVNKEIPIVADEYVEMDFGTGVVKITPAHDPNDFEVGLRHDLPVITIMDDSAVINENGGKYQGLDRYEARKKMVADLESEGLLIKIKDHMHNVGSCQRCKTVVEPMASLQWFVKMDSLASPAIDVVKNGELRIIPDRLEKVYMNWMDNIKDWCISRQLWWGHRIPAYYCNECEEVIVSRQKPKSCHKCGGSVRRDEDTLDTWFSSALWPFSTLGWPDRTEELDYFYPTSTLVTGYDIIFFWVARMIFSGIEYMGEKPFDTVLFHGLVRDEDGRKMSKSLGNGIDPLDVIAEYGADALRLMLVTGNSPGNDMRYSTERVRSGRGFANKLWNATRYIMMNLPEDMTEIELPEKLWIEDKWILSKFNTLAKEVTENLDKFELGVAVSKVHDFIWDIYCDWYIELTKPRIFAGENTDDENAIKSARAAQNVLVYCMRGMLKLLHPFMPFITEELWQAIPNDCESIMIADWVEYDDSLNFEQEEAQFQKVINVIKGVRASRAEMNVPPSKKATLYIETEDTDVFEDGEILLKRLAYADEIKVANSHDVSDMITVVTDSARVFIPLDQLIDKKKELERLSKEKQAIEKDINFLNAKLSNDGFLNKAPQKVIDGLKAKLEKAMDKNARLEQSIKDLKG